MTTNIVSLTPPRARLEYGPGQHAGKGKFCLVANTPLVDPDPGCSVDLERRAGSKSQGPSTHID